jgi:hypothetical protein
MEPMDNDDEEDAEEAEDEFLPLNSPFTPNYSMNGSISPARRDSLGTSPTAQGFASMTAAEKREHSRRHSRVHSRNLSVFFPRPEQIGAPGYQAPGSESPAGPSNGYAVDVPVAQTQGWGYKEGGRAEPAAIGRDDAKTQANSRRGHHHRHSMSHK